MTDSVTTPVTGALPRPARASTPARSAAGWAALQSPAPERARAFYAKVLGLRFEPGGGPGGLWRGLDARGAQVLVVGRSHTGSGPGVWSPCLTVPDVRAAAERVRALCGTVEVGPLPLEGGRGVLGADRQGLGITLWQPATGARITEADRYRLLTPDPADALAFHTRVLEAKALPAPPDATLLLRGTRPLLSVSPLRTGARRPRPRWQPDFLAGDLDRAVAAALAGGATLLVEDEPAARAGRAVLRAPDGTVFGLVRG
ncbi:VOC family protein [Streptomyces sp. SPB074]|uniref:VOC family protein n=1 Tax=Streptomyces sp. (strain SPB074) TaxID=465543 RepID=UPI0001D1E403|nr:VOC family protein [Streptomyces sp. SPB074]EFG65330.1 translation initiation factor IF-2 [Streptomyces sp. SPB074]